MQITEATLVIYKLLDDDTNLLFTVRHNKLLFVAGEKLHWHVFSSTEHSWVLGQESRASSHETEAAFKFLFNFIFICLKSCMDKLFSYCLLISCYLWGICLLRNLCVEPRILESLLFQKFLMRKRVCLCVGNKEKKSLESTMFLIK